MGMMNQTWRGGCLGVSLTILLSFALFAPSATAGQQRSPSAKPAVLTITYDRGPDLLSIQANQVPLGKILQEIAKKTSFIFSSLDETFFEEQISLQTTGLSSERALSLVLKGFNTVFIYTSVDSESGQSAMSRLAKVVLLTKRISTTKETPAIKELSLPEREPDIKPNRAEIEPKSPAAKKHFAVLQTAAKGSQREAAISVLLTSLNDESSTDRLSALVALRRFAPERSVEALINLMQNQNEDGQLRTLAAAGLGEIGDVRAINPLMGVIRDTATTDPMVRQAAANGLVRMGGDRGVNLLIQLLQEGSREQQEIAATALAFGGNQRGGSALTKLRAQGLVPETAIPLVREKEGP